MIDGRRLRLSGDLTVEHKGTYEVSFMLRRDLYLY